MIGRRRFSFFSFLRHSFCPRLSPLLIILLLNSLSNTLLKTDLIFPLPSFQKVNAFKYNLDDSYYDTSRWSFTEMYMYGSTDSHVFVYPFTPKKESFIEIDFRLRVKGLQSNENAVCKVLFYSENSDIPLAPAGDLCEDNIPNSSRSTSRSLSINVKNRYQKLSLPSLLQSVLSLRLSPLSFWGGIVNDEENRQTSTMIIDDTTSYMNRENYIQNNKIQSPSINKKARRQLVDIEDEDVNGNEEKIKISTGDKNDASSSWVESNKEKTTTLYESLDEYDIINPELHTFFGEYSAQDKEWIIDTKAHYQVKDTGLQNVLFQVCPSNYPLEITELNGEISFRNPYGYLPGRFYGYLPFEFFRFLLFLMFDVYYIFLVWKYRNDLVNLHKAILCVLVISSAEALSW